MSMNEKNSQKEPPVGITSGAENLRDEACAEIRALQRRSGRGLWALALFIMVCLVALGDFAVLPDLPHGVKAALGRPPSTKMISGVLVIYTFSAIILTLSRMMSGTGACTGIAHVGYLAGFFGFYHFAGSLEENYLAVVVAGFTVLSLETYHVWSHCQERIKEEQEVIARLDRIEDWKREPDQR